MNRQQWLEWRLDGIGSSDAPVIMGVSPWKTLHQLYIEKKDRIISNYTNPAMQRGHDLEEMCRQKFEELMNVSVFPQNVVHPEMNWLRASFDGLDLDGTTAVEIKNPNRKDHELAAEGKVPDKYYPQCQHLIKTKELTEIYYFSHFDGDYQTVWVDRNDEYLEEYLSKASAFWDSVLRGIPPEKTQKDLTPISNSKWQEKADRCKILRRRIEKDEEEMVLIKSDLIDMTNNLSSVGHGICLQKSTCKGQIDMDKLKKDHPLIEFESYRKPSFDKWTLREVEEED